MNGFWHRKVGKVLQWYTTCSLFRGRAIGICPEVSSCPDQEFLPGSVCVVTWWAHLSSMALASLSALLRQRSVGGRRADPALPAGLPLLGHPDVRARGPLSCETKVDPFLSFAVSGALRKVSPAHLAPNKIGATSFTNLVLPRLAGAPTIEVSELNRTQTLRKRGKIK